ncbi:unnamed protein product [Arabidopsis halleri]
MGRLIIKSKYKRCRIVGKQQHLRHCHSDSLNSSPTANLRSRRLAIDTDSSSSSSTTLESFEKWSSVGENDELEVFIRNFEIIENDVDVTDSADSSIVPIQEKG